MLRKIYTFTTLIPYVVIILLSSSEGRRKDAQRDRAKPYSFLSPNVMHKHYIKIYEQNKRENKKKKKKLELFFSYDDIRIGQGYDIHRICVCEAEDSASTSASTPASTSASASTSACTSGSASTSACTSASASTSASIDGDTLEHQNDGIDKQIMKRLTIGGVKVNNISVLAHSDGDVIFHALVDAILGGLNYSDIGTLFPDRSEKYKNKNSLSFLRYARFIMHKKNYTIGNMDIIVIAEIPKISLIRNQIIRNISSTLAISESKISLKGKTHEKLGPIGEKKAIECFANILLIRKK
ncbi:2C-methyl-D-erythritol 2,4-cyclodiphosphate synthase [Plasmodium gonderi]|uniref:2-C-methyl-D-erythritol 2,4-cyclodiphosphate synthase n=1 Tax=Plasmodium gonderi TaxID=77519 RepID=A0A1Y1JHG2_PLAGO|nr:2C-methyl-D-erythritol 2,4-cyclodiphosphate synthase [Plasmodium gonderi]GAW79514.1 2C-methyl-D-erythritol 2,4-cyclodiphosphate synthase [Plasmodium gonderi]